MLTSEYSKCDKKCVRIQGDVGIDNKISLFEISPISNMFAYVCSDVDMRKDST